MRISHPHLRLNDLSDEKFPHVDHPRGGASSICDGRIGREKGLPRFSMGSAVRPVGGMFLFFEKQGGFGKRPRYKMARVSPHGEDFIFSSASADGTRAGGLYS